MFLNPLGLLALLSLPAIVGLHLYRRRFERHPVSALFLWAAQDHAALAGRQREPLRTSACFWCELLAASLLSLAHAGLRVPGSEDARHLVVVLDGSASMSAVVDGPPPGIAPSRRCARVSTNSPVAPQGTTLVSGPSPATRAGPAVFRARRRAALEDYAPRLGAHDLAPTLGLAGQLAAGGDVLLVTDRYELDAHPDEVALISVRSATEQPVDHPCLASTLEPALASYLGITAAANRTGSRAGSSSCPTREHDRRRRGRGRPGRSARTDQSNGCDGRGAAGPAAAGGSRGTSSRPAGRPLCALDSGATTQPKATDCESAPRGREATRRA